MFRYNDVAHKFDEALMADLAVPKSAEEVHHDISHRTPLDEVKELIAKTKVKPAEEHIRERRVRHKLSELARRPDVDAFLSLMAEEE